jgi:hypothetical protein
MELRLLVKNGQRFLEGIVGKTLVQSDSELTSILEACFNDRIKRLLLHSENFGEEFFDLKSGKAGSVLQKFRNYGIRIAITLPPGLQLSKNFEKVIAEENFGPYFRFFEHRDSAEDWLCMIDDEGEG